MHPSLLLLVRVNNFKRAGYQFRENKYIGVWVYDHIIPIEISTGCYTVSVARRTLISFYEENKEWIRFDFF